jgi:hypothetical protein
LLRELGWMNPIGLQTLQLTNKVPGESLQQNIHFSRGLHCKKKVVSCFNKNRFKKNTCVVSRYSSSFSLLLKTKKTKNVCREGFFILPYNELAIAQGPKIYQKKAL